MVFYFNRLDISFNILSPPQKYLKLLSNESLTNVGKGKKSQKQTDILTAEKNSVHFRLSLNTYPWPTAKKTG